MQLVDYIQQAIPLLEIQLQRQVDLSTRFNADGEVLIDKSKMDQALANVIHNIRDALGNRGETS